MAEIKYIQREETRYANNEFESMPSIDFRGANPPYLTKRSGKRMDWDKVKEICDKYGFKFCTINNTFCGDNTEFVVYLKTDISVEHYNELYKVYDNSREDKERYWEMSHSYDWAFRKLHECVHELDEQTDLMFECGWSGNCGLFGSDDVKRKSYSFGSHLTTWSYIIDRWAPSIHDTRMKLSKGIYAMMTTRYIKPEIQNSPLVEDFEPTLIEIVRGLIGDKFTAKFEHGKRQCDTDTDGYRALVVRYAENGEYCGMVTFNRDWMGRYHITSAAPLCGQSSWVMDWQNPTEDLKSAVYFVN